MNASTSIAGLYGTSRPPVQLAQQSPAQLARNMTADVERLMRDYPFIMPLPILRAGIQTLHQEIKNSQRSVQGFRNTADNYSNHIRDLDGKVATLTNAAINREAEMQTIQRESNMKDDTIRDFMEKAEAQDDYIQTLEVVRSKQYRTIEEKDAQIHHSQSVIHNTQQYYMRKMAGMKARIRELEAQNGFHYSNFQDSESDGVPNLHPLSNNSDSDHSEHEYDEDVQLVQPPAAIHIDLTHSTDRESTSNGSSTSTDLDSDLTDFESEASPNTQSPSKIQVDLTTETSESQSDLGEDSTTSFTSSDLSGPDFLDYESDARYHASPSEKPIKSNDSQSDDDKCKVEGLGDFWADCEAGNGGVKYESGGNIKYESEGDNEDLYGATPIREESFSRWYAKNESDSSKGIKREREQYENVADDEDTEEGEYGRYYKCGRLSY